jgi:hypothetical protein
MPSELSVSDCPVLSFFGRHAVHPVGPLVQHWGYSVETLAKPRLLSFLLRRNRVARLALETGLKARIGVF